MKGQFLILHMSWLIRNVRLMQKLPHCKQIMNFHVALCLWIVRILRLFLFNLPWYLTFSTINWQICYIWKTDVHSCWLYWNFISGGRWMLSKYSNRINFHENLEKMEKAVSRKGQTKLFLLELNTKIKEMWTTGYNGVERGANNIDTRVKILKWENPGKKSIQLNSVQRSMKRWAATLFHSRCSLK